MTFDLRIVLTFVDQLFTILVNIVVQILIYNPKKLTLAFFDDKIANFLETGSSYMTALIGKIDIRHRY